jgi:hypothetical protein
MNSSMHLEAKQRQWRRYHNNAAPVGRLGVALLWNQVDMQPIAPEKLGLALPCHSG